MKKKLCMTVLSAVLALAASGCARVVGAGMGFVDGATDGAGHIIGGVFSGTVKIGGGAVEGATEIVAVSLEGVSVIIRAAGEGVVIPAQRASRGWNQELIKGEGVREEKDSKDTETDKRQLTTDNEKRKARP